MDRLGFGARRSIEHLADIEVAFACWGGPQPHRSVRLQDVAGIDVGVAVDRDRPDA
ncbi:Uncharacterised protein [Mycobacterium tuberculosis]|uniref:Uncharacterized protein n=1 Tax=Mycobacterium tuberculosis TaxID=1773 RepID=A0A655DPN2_MYCTX|nr:Uncharacterised protein [Mycobacterium tuberculosis]